MIASVKNIHSSLDVVLISPGGMGFEGPQTSWLLGFSPSTSLEM